MNPHARSEHWNLNGVRPILRILHQVTEFLKALDIPYLLGNSAHKSNSQFIGI